ncbi:MAG: hypothetical protein ACREPE_07085 [Lysobacter sp.]
MFGRWGMALAGQDPPYEALFGAVQHALYGLTPTPRRGYTFTLCTDTTGVFA